MRATLKKWMSVEEVVVLQVTAVELLLVNGVAPNVKTNDGQTFVGS